MERFSDLQEVIGFIQLHSQVIIITSLALSCIWFFILVYTEEFLPPNSKFRNGVLYTVLSVICVFVVFLVMWINSERIIAALEESIKRNGLTVLSKDDKSMLDNKK